MTTVKILSPSRCVAYYCTVLGGVARDGTSQKTLQCPLEGPFCHFDAILRDPAATVPLTTCSNLDKEGAASLAVAGSDWPGWQPLDKAKPGFLVPLWMGWTWYGASRWFIETGRSAPLGSSKFAAYVHMYNLRRATSCRLLTDWRLRIAKYNSIADTKDGWLYSTNDEYMSSLSQRAQVDIGALERKLGRRKTSEARHHGRSQRLTKNLSMPMGWTAEALDAGWNVLRRLCCAVWACQSESTANARGPPSVIDTPARLSAIWLRQSGADGVAEA
ncbi:hypothetical protein TgHK011_005695 [Trichoderma gracile]|nr:hypothetical protein TgHK011_005695 [Trichoderma gracile]